MVIIKEEWEWVRMDIRLSYEQNEMICEEQKMTIDKTKLSTKHAPLSLLDNRKVCKPEEGDEPSLDPNFDEDRMGRSCHAE